MPPPAANLPVRGEPGGRRKATRFEGELETMHTMMLYETHLAELAREEKKLRLERLALAARSEAAPTLAPRPSLIATVRQAMRRLGGEPRSNRRAPLAS